MLTLLFLLFTLMLWLALYLFVREPANRTFRWLARALLLFAALLADALIRQPSYGWLLGGIGVLALLADVVVVRRGVLLLGENFWSHFLRSLDAAFVFAFLFGAPVAVTMLVATGATLPMRILLLVTLTWAVVTQVFAERFQQALDRFAFPTQPDLQRARSDLRSASEELPKLDPTQNPIVLNENDFVRLTRRALSHYSDLPKLTANPLTRLPVIDARMVARHATDNSLERAAELKRLLHDAILQLKPANNSEFNPSEEWRHYNALYFPYILGLKPYNRRDTLTPLDPASRQALDWFQSQIPERTLHNWQNAAAKLVAQYLREL